ncbi:hypothetical protein [Virgibacillus profundi]|uniref:hypothetical protein n=1 Tax=Virgibacillus profundi TaxID=2024555 RepID=UPI0013FDF87A|nr:hypothetical protein [Virgibacillus profundi]
MNKTNYIFQLSEQTQKEITTELKQVFGKDDNENIQLALDSRLCDLSDTIDIEKYL